jgi:hypothetical protein
LADTFAVLGAASPGAAAYCMAAAGAALEPADVMPPHAASDTPATAAPIAASIGLRELDMIFLFRKGWVGRCAAPRGEDPMEAGQCLVET